MRKMGRKIMAFAAAAAMAAGVPSAVFAEETSEAAEESGDLLEAVDLEDIIPDETVTLDVFDQLANYSGEQVGWFGQIMLDKFNVKLNIISQPDKSVYQTRMESGDLGDIVIWGNDGDDYLKAIDQGMLYDWNEDDLLADYGQSARGTLNVRAYSDAEDQKKYIVFRPEGLDEAISKSATATTTASAGGGNTATTAPEN